MFTIIGIVVVFGAVIAGYLMEHGNLKVLIQPAELVIIGGAAIGTVLIANPLHILKKIAGGLGAAFGCGFLASRYSRAVPFSKAATPSLWQALRLAASRRDDARPYRKRQRMVVLQKFQSSGKQRYLETLKQSWDARGLGSRAGQSHGGLASGPRDCRLGSGSGLCRVPARTSWFQKTTWAT